VGVRFPDRQVYSEIKCLGFYKLSLLIAAARISYPASSPVPIQLLDEKETVERCNTTKVGPQEKSFLPSPNLILGSVRPCDLWTVTAQGDQTWQMEGGSSRPP
jgi:hypothetical protein